MVTGYVPDVTPYFTGCRVSIAPLRYGAGVKGKINLAMSYGLPVVATTPSVEGMFLVARAGRARRRRCQGLRRRHRAPVSRRGAVGAARRGRPREHPRALLARRGAQRDHAPHRVRASGSRRAANAQRGHSGRPLSSLEDEIERRVAEALAARLELGERPRRRARREAVRGVSQQRLGRERREDLVWRSLPSRSRRAGSRRAPAAARARARTRASAAAACDGASWATGRERTRARRPATPAAIMCVDDLDRVVADDAHVAKRLRVELREQRADAGPCTSTPRKSSSGCDAAICRRRLAHAEADLEDDGRAASEDRREVERLRRVVDAVARPESVERARLRRATCAPAAARSCASAARCGVRGAANPSAESLRSTAARFARAGRRELHRERLGVLPRRGDVGPRRGRLVRRAPCARRRATRATR